ncbi:hypothetical protein [Candidatus Thiodictyon syntrophicum]|jgi:hypothetical protein|uniref:Uncharacterized protein n=1 Tax=Candidatus Thiodictyon syntrophicum TaxID=1166950 RepID=A0A2K8U3G7_9GAMM|nr:hypothetical protein [Candidatus Thiodictyon syntrophicum]AUB80134.1 hypothetical protein THSYN_03595 [Candidatus Thiodictyon syntrophicum]
MLKTIEVEIDDSGRVHPVEPLAFILRGRAYLTMLPDTDARPTATTAARALELLASPRFAQRPSALPDEIQGRIDTLRCDWDDR